jgi:hypothetical protein
MEEKSLQMALEIKQRRDQATDKDKLLNVDVVMH